MYKSLHVESDVETLLIADNRISRNQSFIEKVVLVC